MSNFYLNLFSKETWKAFIDHGQNVSGFSKHQKTQASRISPGSILLCYTVKFSRWVGALEILESSYEASEPIFHPTDDKFIIRFKVKPLVVLAIQDGIPITDPLIWSKLDWTKNIQPGSVGWGANFQKSLRLIPEDDGNFLFERLKDQLENKKEFKLNSKEQRELDTNLIIKTTSGTFSVEIPEDISEESFLPDTDSNLRESLKIQAAIAKIGALMGFKIWMPKNDITQLENELDEKTKKSLLSELPLSFDDTTLKTIENIDVLWIESRTIVRAFEVEHTTAIYSGLLRMADLIALVPNLNLPLHIVAPSERQEKVFREINRPVFQLMETKLSECCTFIPYENVYEILNMPKLQHMSHTIIEDYQVSRDY
jgi:hypothetical protein